MKRKPGPKPSKYRMKFWEALPQATQKPIGSILQDIDNTVKEGFQAIGRNDGSEVQIVSEAVAKLPAYMKGLGYYLAEAENEANVSKDYYEQLKTGLEKDLMEEPLGSPDKPVKFRSATEAEKIATINEGVVLAKDAMRKAQHNFRILKLQYESTDRQVRGFTSRLATIRPELERGQ